MKINGSRFDQILSVLIDLKKDGYIKVLCTDSVLRFIMVEFNTGQCLRYYDLGNTFGFKRNKLEKFISFEEFLETIENRDVKRVFLFNLDLFDSCVTS